MITLIFGIGLTRALSPQNCFRPARTLVISSRSPTVARLQLSPTRGVIEQDYRSGRQTFAHYRQQTVTPTQSGSRWPIANDELKFFRHLAERRVVPFEFTKAAQRSPTNLNIRNFKSLKHVRHSRPP